MYLVDKAKQSSCCTASSSLPPSSSSTKLACHTNLNDSGHLQWYTLLSCDELTSKTVDLFWIDLQNYEI